MIFRSLRTAITVLTISAVAGVATATVFYAINEYQRLFRSYSAQDLDALSENLSSDLIPLLAENADPFEITSVLLRLEEYQQVRLAVVLDRERRLISQYVGQAMSSDTAFDAANVSGEIARFVDRAADAVVGVSPFRGNLFALKRVGDESLPQGYLLISTDLAGPLDDSTGRLLGKLLPLAVATIAGIALLLLALLARLFRPLQALGEFTQKIRASRNYGLQAPLEGTREISELTANFNSMMRDIDSEVETNKRQTELLMAQQEQMERLANFDSLTGLSNRQFFMQTLRLALSRAKRDKHDFAVLFLDLDGFKGVNDSHGHEIGDKLLVEIGREIREQLREADLVARLGGDEFLIMLDSEPDAHAASVTGERLINRISRPHKIDSWHIQVGASIGIATAQGAGYSLSELMIHADVAMYRSKLGGKGCCTIFEAEMAADEQRQLAIAGAIVPAIDNDAFELHYQPKVDREGRVVSFEALIRWRNEVLGNIPPSEFIGIAERSGQIRKLTRWVISRCCRDLHALQAVAGPEVTVALNLSVYDLRDKALADELIEAFGVHQVDPHCFELEITETAYLNNFDTANEIFQRVRTIGCRIALDDFGTGYSSLGYLTKISIDSLKIDKQFIDRVGESERDSLLTRTIIEMARQLGLITVAEGVESEEQARFLIDAGCDLLQGYYYGKPTPLRELPELLGNQPPALVAPLEAAANA